MINIYNNLFSDLTKDELLFNLFKRLESYFFLNEEDKDVFRSYHSKVLERIESCFVDVENKYYRNNEGELYFSHTHSGHNLCYLYFFSNELYKDHNNLSSKVYYLNKIMNSVDILGAVELPKSFFFEHPLGMVLGRAKYGNNFFAMQGCTVGGNKGKYPTIGNNIKMYSNSKILGNSKIGDNVLISANCYVKDTDILNNKMVFGQSPNLIIKDLPR